MSLADLWFVLFVAIIAAYLVLDGFDLGVGILHPFAARNDEERRIVLNSIGPIWDGNEVWLVVGGGVLFAAFPVVYAALFSGFYWALMLVLMGLILRTVAIEFRSKREGAGWRRLWDTSSRPRRSRSPCSSGWRSATSSAGCRWARTGTSTSAASWTCCARSPSSWGLTTIAMLAMHGALYLAVKTEGDLQTRVRRWIPWLIAVFALMAGGLGRVDRRRRLRRGGHLHRGRLDLVFPLAALVAFITIVVMHRAGRAVAAFFASCATIGTSLATISAGLYPNMLKSSTDPAYSMTVTNASAASETLTVMLVVAIIGLPFVLLYTAGVQYLFSGKVKLTPSSY